MNNFNFPQFLVRAKELRGKWALRSIIFFLIIIPLMSSMLVFSFFSCKPGEIKYHTFIKLRDERNSHSDTVKGCKFRSFRIRFGDKLL
jgi:hypothetical protein